MDNTGVDWSGNISSFHFAKFKAARVVAFKSCVVPAIVSCC